MAKILIVDEDLIVGQSAKRAFRLAGHKVVLVTSSEDALNCLKEIGFDAMVTDLSLSKSHGWTLLQQVQSEPEIAPLPIVVTSAFFDSQQAVIYLRAGAADFLEKPFQIEELVIRVDRLIAQHQDIKKGMQGFLDVYSVADLAQNFAQSKKSGWLEIYSQAEIGYLIFNHGQITKARYGSLHELEAFWGMHEVKQGTFQFLPERDVSSFANLRPLNLNSALMRAAWVEDELAKFASFTLEPQQVLGRLKTASALPAMQEGELLKRILNHFDQHRRLNKAQLIDAGLASTLRLVFALAWLSANGFLAHSATTGADLIEVNASCKKLPCKVRDGSKDRFVEIGRKVAHS